MFSSSGFFCHFFLSSFPLLFYFLVLVYDCYFVHSIFGGGNGSESGVPMDTRADVPVRLPVGDGKSYFGSHTATEELSTMGGTAAGMDKN